METTIQIKYVLTNLFYFKISCIWSLIVPTVCLSLPGTSATQTEMRPTSALWAWHSDEDLVYNLDEDLGPLHLLRSEENKVLFNLS